MTKESNEGITAKKKENFSEWYSQVIDKAEIADLRYNVKGFVVIRSWGAMLMENMFKIYESTLQKRGHQPMFFPVVIPEKNFKKESEHVKGFSPEVFWLEPVTGEDRLALRPTSETAMYQMYALWIRSWRDLPFKKYQRANVYRYETKATRPLIRSREFYWIEAHNCFATKEDAEKQVQNDILTTEEVMHKKFIVPFLPLKRPTWDKFAGAEYTVGSDSLMPDGKVIQQPSTHLLGQHFSKAFDVKFKDKEGKEQFVWQTCYGPAISRILASVISVNGDDSGLVLPYIISPIKVVIVPIWNKNNEEKVFKELKKITKRLDEIEISYELDTREKRPGEKYYEWELKGVPFRLEIGEKEIEEGKATLFIRDTKEKIKISLSKLNEIKKLGIDYDERLLKKADKENEGKIINCETIEEIKKIIDSGKIARVSFCSTQKEGMPCAEVLEKKIGADVRGTLANKKEKVFSSCPFCKKEAHEVVYIAKSY